MPLRPSIAREGSAIERIAVVGSRSFPAREAVDQFVLSLPTGSVVVSGGARGVDGWAVEAAQRAGLATQIFHADWAAYGRKAGPIRNAEIVAAVDRVVAFWDLKSRGTLNTVCLAIERQTPVEVRGPDGQALVLDDVLNTASDRGILDSIRAGQDRAHRSTR